MVRSIVVGAALGALTCGGVLAAPAAPRPMGVAWSVSVGEGVCRTRLELTGRSGALVPVTLVSDGAILTLKFSKPDLPERAFLPIRIDRVRYSNLMLRGPDGDTGELVISEPTVQALRKGAMLDIAWLAEEPVGVPLAGSEQAVDDLRICGAQAAADQRTRAAASQAARERANAEARAKALSDAQLSAARAQAAAAEAEARRVADDADRQRRAEAAEREAAYRAERERAYEEAQSRRAYDDAMRRDYEDEWRPYPAYRWYPRD